MKIGAEVRKARKALGLSQAKYGHLVGVGQQAISKIERDANDGIDGETLLRLVQKGGLVLTENGEVRAA